MQTVRISMTVFFLWVLCAWNLAAAFAQKETLSHFLGSELKAGELLVLEGDRYIDLERKELCTIAASNRSIEDKVVAIAEKCDYDVSSFNGAYLLRKRYSGERELPCVTYKELLRFNEDLSRVLGSLFGPSALAADVAPQIHSLLLSLSQDDWGLVQRDVLPVRALSPWSRQLFVGLLAQTYCGSLINFCNAVIKWGNGLDDTSLGTGTNNLGERHLIATLSLRSRPDETRGFPPRMQATSTGEGNADSLIKQNASFYGSRLSRV